MKYMVANCKTSEVYEANKDKLYADIKSSNLAPIHDADLDDMLNHSREGDPINFQHAGTWYDAWIEN